MRSIEIRDLGIIGDQQTSALVTKTGEIVWYCPFSFDTPSLFASLLDETKGNWVLKTEELTFLSRNYIEESGILETYLKSKKGNIKVTDFMPDGTDIASEGICRGIETTHDAVTSIITPAPSYGSTEISLTHLANGTVQIKDEWNEFYVFGNFPLEIMNRSIYMNIPAGQKGWMFLSNYETDYLDDSIIQKWFLTTRNHWRNIATHFSYKGIYEKEIVDSIRAIRLLTNDYNGGIIAAATTSLPEVIGGERNYDYRYVWLRDTGMIASALTRAGSTGEEGRKFLDFICDASHQIPNFFYKPLFAIGKIKVLDEVYLDFKGYENSRPVRVGNNANEQLQLDSLGNVLLAAKLIYNKTQIKEHWETIEKVADFLVNNWHKEDHGLWEETRTRQYTSSKVIASMGLDFISDHQDDEDKKKVWLSTSKEIRDFIMTKCLTSSGAFAVYSGSEDVDISASLFPVWDFISADHPAVVQTIKEIEFNYRCENLYWRHLEDFQSENEGPFLAANFWMAQYYVMLNDFDKAQTIINECLKYTNDLGLFSEEAEPTTGRMIGNFPQSFVHAAFIGAVIDLKEAMQKNYEL